MVEDGLDGIQSLLQTFRGASKFFELLTATTACLFLGTHADPDCDVVNRDPKRDEHSNRKRSFGVEGEVSDRRAAKVGSLAT
jgi:hypothetical protein